MFFFRDNGFFMGFNEAGIVMSNEYHLIDEPLQHTKCYAATSSFPYKGMFCM